MTSFFTKNKAVVITFDACESITPSYFDDSLVQLIERQKLPCTIFLGGKFARRNEQKIRALNLLPYVSFGNHSYSHPEHMERLSKEQMITEITRTDSVIQKYTGKKSVAFRFPAGNYTNKALQVVESLGLKTVHWSFASGDADKNISAFALLEWLKYKTRPGSILIFHINRRGWKTAEVLPKYLSWLKEQGYLVKRLPDVMQ